MSLTTKTHVPIVLGTMTIGKPGVEQTRVHEVEDAAMMLTTFQSFGHNEVDTARAYGQGSSEEYLGKLGWQERGIVMATKHYPRKEPGTTHSPEDLRQNLLTSLKALKATRVDIWYLHGPDRNTPFEVTFKAVNELHEEGYFSRLGISNFMAWEVAAIQELCIRNRWIRPTVYQGLYNVLHRSVETELFQCLRNYGVAFYAFNPLAGGYLTSKFRSRDTQSEAGSRFDSNTNQGKWYRDRYWNDAMFSAMQLVREAAEMHKLTEKECALRWMMHHSKLDRECGDAVIIGASSTEQLESNLTDLEKGSLPDEVLSALDRAWGIAKAVACNYFH